MKPGNIVRLNFIGLAELERQPGRAGDILHHHRRFHGGLSIRSNREHTVIFKQRRARLTQSLNDDFIQSVVTFCADGFGSNVSFFKRAILGAASNTAPPRLCAKIHVNYILASAHLKLLPWFNNYLQTLAPLCHSKRFCRTFQRKAVSHQ